MKTLYQNSYTHIFHETGIRGRSRTAATSKMECFVIIVNGWKPLTTITKHSILDVAAALDPPLGMQNLILVLSNNLNNIYPISQPIVTSFVNTEN